jgi:hypothetical protein
MKKLLSQSRPSHCPVILSEVVGGCERRISKYEECRPGHDFLILRIFAHTHPPALAQNDGGLILREVVATTPHCLCGEQFRGVIR